TALAELREHPHAAVAVDRVQRVLELRPRPESILRQAHRRLPAGVRPHLAVKADVRGLVRLRWAVHGREGADGGEDFDQDPIKARISPGSRGVPFGCLWRETR